MLSILSKPKPAMIFGVLCMTCGLGVFCLWNVRALSHWDIAGTDIIDWCRENLGRYGISAFYFFGGVLIFLRGHFALRAEEKQRDSRQF